MIPSKWILACALLLCGASAQAAAEKPLVWVFCTGGAGGLSKFEKNAIKSVAATKGPKPVLVRSSRTGNGRVIATDRYMEIGALPADSLNPQKAGILLMLALTKTIDPKEIRRMFAEY